MQEDEVNETIEIHPCTEHGLVTLEAKLGKDDEDYYDAEIMGFALRYSPFSDIKYSKEMGYGFALYEGKRLHMFKHGKIIIRRADDREVALKLLETCMRVLLPAVICESDRPMISLYRGECGDCTPTMCSPLKRFVKSGTETIELIDLMKDASLPFEDRKGALERVLEILKKDEANGFKDIYAKIESERKALFESLIKSEEAVEITGSLVFLGLYANIEGVMDILSGELEGGDRRRAMDMTLDALGALVEGSRSKLESIQAASSRSIEGEKEGPKTVSTLINNIAAASFNPLVITKS
jgi:hypothetical protein